MTNNSWRTLCSRRPLPQSEVKCNTGAASVGSRDGRQRDERPAHRSRRGLRSARGRREGARRQRPERRADRARTACERRVPVARLRRRVLHPRLVAQVCALASSSPLAFILFSPNCVACCIPQNCDE